MDDELLAKIYENLNLIDSDPLLTITLDSNLQSVAEGTVNKCLAGKIISTKHVHHESFC